MHPAFADRIDRLNAAIGRAAAWARLFDRAGAVRRGGAALRVRHGLDLAAEVDHLRPRGAVHAGRRLDAARGRPCAGRRVLCRCLAAHQGAGSISAARCCCCCRSCWCWPGSRCPMWRARGRSWSARARPAALPLVFLLKTLIPLFALLMALQGVSQAIRAAHRAAAAEALTMAARRNPRRADGGRGLRPAVRRLSGGAHARRRVARLRRARSLARRDELRASSARCRSASSA